MSDERMWLLSFMALLAGITFQHHWLVVGTVLSANIVIICAHAICAAIREGKE